MDIVCRVEKLSFGKVKVTSALKFTSTEALFIKLRGPNEQIQKERDGKTQVIKELITIEIYQVELDLG